MPIFRLTQDIVFPNPLLAEPDGLLAVGGDLSLQRLFLAYENGIFPWFADDMGRYFWYAPNPRAVVYPSQVYVSRSMRKVLEKRMFRITFDACFEEVMARCATHPRRGQEGTWLNDDFVEAYSRLHLLGFAHSVEVWLGNELVGGLYGVSLGRSFFGESMFAQVSNASKAGFIGLARHLQHWQFRLIDCQQDTAHLRSLGAVSIRLEDYLSELEVALSEEPPASNWVFEEHIGYGLLA
jgi:leucyl/phenylalanyl-tRNA--protein transferase